VAGAFAAAMFYSLQPVIQKHVPVADITFLLVGLGAVSLGRNPGGFAGQLSAAVEQVRALSERFGAGRRPVYPHPLGGPDGLITLAAGDGRDVVVPEDRLVAR
jgi:hypothetical protein